jgi:hypothetical protein
LENRIGPGRRSKGRRDEDNIALIPLHILQILHEEAEAFLFVSLLELVNIIELANAFLEKLINKLPLLQIQGYDTKTVFAPVTHVCEHRIHHDIRFLYVHLAIVGRIIDVANLTAEISASFVGRREDD